MFNPYSIDLRPSSTKKPQGKQYRERRNTGDFYKLHLDQETIEALETCQKSLSSPKEITYAHSSIVRRAIQHYHDTVIAAITNSRRQNKLELLAEEGTEVRLAGASSPLRRR